eukprot:1237403-Pyramimonas_sp.AAC.1
MDGHWTIVDMSTQMERPEVPHDCVPPLIVTSMDQCSIGRSAMFFAAQRRQLLLLMHWDIYHRLWNDVLGAAGKAAQLRRSILFLTHPKGVLSQVLVDDDGRQRVVPGRRRRDRRRPRQDDSTEPI